jgi:hypothetical protein
MTNLGKRIGFLGAGQMAEALARGLMAKGVVTADQICCNDPWAVRREVFKSFGAVPYESNIDVSRPPDRDRRRSPRPCRHRAPAAIGQEVRGPCPLPPGAAPRRPARPAKRRSPGTRT